MVASLFVDKDGLLQEAKYLEKSEANKHIIPKRVIISSTISPTISKRNSNLNSNDGQGDRG